MRQRSLCIPQERFWQPQREQLSIFEEVQFFPQHLIYRVNWIYTQLMNSVYCGCVPSENCCLLFCFSEHESFEGLRFTVRHIIFSYPVPKFGNPSKYGVTRPSFNWAVRQRYIFAPQKRLWHIFILCIFQELSSKLIGSGSSETSAADDGSFPHGTHWVPVLIGWPSNKPTLSPPYY